MAQLIISSWYATCGTCHRDADMSERAHDTLLGYGVKPGETGCGQLFTSVVYEYCVGYASPYMHPDTRAELELREPRGECATKTLRPDLLSDCCGSL